MIRTIKGELAAECNDCGYRTFGGFNDDFRAFVDEIKDEGWLVRQEEDEWCHYCPDCAREMRS